MSDSIVELIKQKNKLIDRAEIAEARVQELEAYLRVALSALTLAHDAWTGANVIPTLPRILRVMMESMRDIRKQVVGEGSQ